MKSKRTIGLSLGFVVLVSSVVWLAWNFWLGGVITPMLASAGADASGSAEKEDSAASDELPERPTSIDENGDKASPQVDFTGQWQLDSEASDSLDPILKAIGLSIFERTMVNNTVVTHVISQTDDEFLLEIKTTFFNRTDRLPLNGELTPTLDPSGRPVESVNCWSADGKRLISKIQVKKVEQNFTLTRSMDEGQDTMEVFVEFFPKEGPPLTSRRVYHRVMPEAAGK